MRKVNKVDRIISEHRNEVAFAHVEDLFEDAQGRRWAQVSYMGQICCIPAPKDLKVGERIVFVANTQNAPLLVERFFKQNTPSFLSVPWTGEQAKTNLIEFAINLLAPYIDLPEAVPEYVFELSLLAPNIATTYTILGTIAMYRPVKYGSFMEIIFDGEYLYAYYQYSTSFSAVAVSSGTQYLCVRTNAGVAVHEVVEDPEYRTYLQDVSFNELHWLPFERPNIPHIDVEISDSYVAIAKYDTATEEAFEMSVYDLTGEPVNTNVSTITMLVGQATSVLSVSGSAKSVWIGQTKINNAELLSYVPDSSELALQAWFDATGTRLFLPKVNAIGVFDLQGEQADEIIYDIPSVIRGDEMAKIPTVFVFDDQYLVGSLTQNLSYLYAFLADRTLNVGSYDPIICYDYLLGDPEKPAHTMLQVRPWQKFVLVPK